jgi:hypothetical protein
VYYDNAIKEYRIISVGTMMQKTYAIAPENRNGESGIFINLIWNDGMCLVSSHPGEIKVRATISAKQDKNK